MRIVHVVTKFDVGGAQSVVRSLAIRQHDAGHEVLVFTGLGGGVADEVSRHGVEVVVNPDFVHAPSAALDVRAFRALTKTLVEFNPAVIHCHSSKGGLLGRAAARRLAAPVVYTAHGWPFQRGAPIGRRLASATGEWLGSRLGGVVVCVTEHDQQLARRWRITRSAQTVMIPNGTEPVSGNGLAMRTSASDPFVVAMVARFTAPKRHDVVLEALALLPLHVSLLMVGGGRGLDGARQLATRIGVADRVEFAGDQDDAGPMLRRAHALVLASDYEGLSMSVLEGMSLGLPIVVNVLPGVAEAIRCAKEGLLVENRPQAFADALLRLTEDPALARELGSAGKSRWEESFNATLMYSRYMHTYDAVTKASRN
jgi:glycosyltransferase involved in cell wall biosynthesis